MAAAVPADEPAAVGLIRQFFHPCRHPFPYLPYRPSQSLCGLKALRSLQPGLAAAAVAAAAVASLITRLLPHHCGWVDYCPAVQEVVPSTSAEFVGPVV